MIENLKQIEQAFGLEEGKFLEMINSENKEVLELENIVIEPKSIQEERINNIKDHASKTAREITIKSIKKAFGLDFEGKYEENLIESLQKREQQREQQIKDEVVKDPEERYKNLHSDFQKIQNNLQEEILKRTELEQSYAQKEKKSKIQNDFFNAVPNELVISKGTLLIEAEQKGYSFDILEGITVIKDQNGEVLKDEKTFSPLKIESWAKNFATPYVKQVSGGSGQSDDVQPLKAGSFEAFEKEAERNNWDRAKTNEEMAKRIKDGTLVV